MVRESVHRSRLMARLTTMNTWREARLPDSARMCPPALALTSRRPTVVRNLLLLLLASAAASWRWRKIENTSPAESDRFGPRLVSIARMARHVTEQGGLRLKAMELEKARCSAVSVLCEQIGLENVSVCFA